MFATGKRAERGGLGPASLVQSSLQQDERGVVVVEYVMVLLVVCMAAGSALVLLGLGLAKFYGAQEAWLNLPFP